MLPHPAPEPVPLDPTMTHARVQRRLSELDHYRTPERWPVGGWEVSRAWPAHLARPAFADDLDRLNDDPNDGAGGAGTTDAFSAPAKDAQTYWLGTTATVPDGLDGERVTLRFDTQAESMVYVDGEPWQALDENRSDVVLAQEGRAGREVRIDVMLFSSRDRQPKALSAAFVRTDEAVERYRHDLRAVLGVAKTLPEGGLTATRLRQALVASTNALDFHSAYGSVDVAEAARVLHEHVEALRETTPPTDLDVWLVGNSHIDVTWLWTLPETRAKMGRTTATALRYLDELPSYRFAQSQPQLYEFLRQDFPDLFARVQERVAEGRWEIVGAAWVEPDCNVTGGESLVRQILHGQRFWQEHFGRTSTVMWLPDTFGYAWALPQILRKSGIDTFVTQKLTWNNENTFPYGHFDWEGVDGTRVRCTFPQVYVARVDPETIDEFYGRIPETETVPSLLFLYGYGDGGGGPMREDVELGERLDAMPGFPRCTFTTARDALDKIRDEADAIAERTGRDVPVWKGELYLESHRGTLTTHARVKKGTGVRDAAPRGRGLGVASRRRGRGGRSRPRRSTRRGRTCSSTSSTTSCRGRASSRSTPVSTSGTRETLATAEEVTTAALADALRPRCPARRTDRRLAPSVHHPWARPVERTYGLSRLTVPGGGGLGVTAWNSLGWEVTDWVEADAPGGASGSRRAGRAVPHQTTHDGRIGWEATVPALGTATYALRPAPPDRPAGLRPAPTSWRASVPWSPTVSASSSTRPGASRRCGTKQKTASGCAGRRTCSRRSTTGPTSGRRGT